MLSSLKEINTEELLIFTKLCTLLKLFIHDKFALIYCKHSCDAIDNDTFKTNVELLRVFIITGSTEIDGASVNTVKK